MEYKNNFNDRQYNGDDVKRALQSRLNERHNQSFEYFIPPIDVLDAVDDAVEGQLERRLQQERKFHTGKRITLIPYYIGNSHWSGILLAFDSQGGIERAEYIDPVKGSNVIPVRVRNQFAKVYAGDILQISNLQKQDSPRNSADLMIENLLTAAGVVTLPRETLSELERRLDSGLKMLNISDVTKLPEKIKQTEQKIEDYIKKKKNEYVEKEKAKLTKLQELIELSKKIATILRILNGDEFKIYNMKRELVTGLTKWNIQNVTQLSDKIQEIEERIQDYQRRNKKVQKEEADLDELRKLMQIEENIKSSECILLNKVRKARKDHQVLSQDLEIIPTCAEKTIMKLQQHFQRKLLNDCIPSSTNDSPSDLLNQLNIQIKRQELITEEIRKNLQYLKRCVNGDDYSATVHILKEVLKKIWPINVQEIRRLVAKAEEAAERIRHKDIILVVGTTGSGKSTTIQFLAGTKMKRTKVEVAPGKYLEHIEPIDPNKNPSLIHVTSCNPLNKSETRYIVPVMVPLKGIFGAHTTGYINLCDVPSFDDTIDAEVDIANSIGIIEALKQCSNVKLLALSSYQGLNDRGQDIQKLAHLLISIVNGIENRLNTIVYAFTKFPLSTDIHALLLDIKASTVDSNVLLRSDSAFVNLLEDMIKKTENSDDIVDPIGGDPKDLIEKLKRADSIQYPEQVFRCWMNEQTKTAIRNQVQQYKLSIMCAIKYKDNDLLIYYLNDFKLFKDLLKQNDVRNAYDQALHFVKETITKSCREMIQKFNSSFASHDRLRDEEIRDFKDFIDYIENSKKLSGCLGSNIMTTTSIVKNLEFELQKRTHALIKEDLCDPLVKTFLDNLCLFKDSLKLFESIYKTSCKDFLESFERLAQSVRELIKVNELEQVALTISRLSESAQALKIHLGKQLEQTYQETVKFLLEHLSSFADKADSLLVKRPLNDSNMNELRNYMDILRSAKDNSILKERISTYIDMVKSQADMSREKFQDLNEIYNRLIAKIVTYFDEISNRIEDLFKENDDYVLDYIEPMITEMELIRTIPELELKTAGSYYRTVEWVRKYMQQKAREVQKVLLTIDNQSENSKYTYLSKSLSRLKKAKWINRISLGAHDILMRRIGDELRQYVSQLEDRLKKLDLSLKFHENITVAQGILERIESLRILETSIPELEKCRLDVFKTYLKSTQKTFDFIQRTFNLQDSTVYKIKQELIELKQTRDDYENLHPANLYLRRQEASGIDSLNREINSLKRKNAIELVNKDQDRITRTRYSLNRLETIKRKHHSLLLPRTATSSEEISYLENRGFHNFESLCAKIEEQKRIIDTYENQPHDFSGKFDASIASSALVYLSQCEKGCHVYVKEMAVDTTEILKKYICEYGNFLNQQINRNFESLTNIDPRENYSEYSNDLEKHLTELSSLSRFDNVFDCIDGAEKQKKWYNIFRDYHQSLSDKMEEFKASNNSRELYVRLNIAQALSCIDSFCASVFVGNGFRVLHRQYHMEVKKQYKEVYMAVMEHISKGDYERATILLSHIDDGPLNERDSAQIKHELQISLSELMTDTRSILHSLCDTIERGEDIKSQLKEIKDKIEKVKIAMNQSILIELLDGNTKTNLEIFMNDIDKILSDTILRGLDVIETLINTDSFLEAEQGLKNISVLQREFAAYCSSTATTEKVRDLNERWNDIVNEISKRDFEDISKYLLSSPKDLIVKLKIAAQHGHVKFHPACNLILGKIRLSFSKVIEQARAAPLENRTDKINSLNYALHLLPDELQASFSLQLDELRKSVNDEERIWRHELEEALASVDNDDHTIRKLGILAQRYNEQNAYNIFEILRTETLKKLNLYRENVASALDQQDMESAINITKKILRYNQLIGSNFPEIETIDKNVRDLVIKSFLNCCNTVANISTVEHAQLVEKAFYSMTVSVSFLTTFDEEIKHVLENGNESLIKMYKYLYENSEKYHIAIKKMHIIELHTILVIAKRWDGLLQTIKQCHSKHEFIQLLMRDIVNVIPYRNMIVELQKEINYLKEQLNVELISDETTHFEKKREEFFSNLMKLINTLREIDYQFNDILPIKIEIDKLEADLKKKIENLGAQLLAIASKDDLSTNDADQFRRFYNHLLTLDKYAARLGLNTRQFLDMSEEKVLGHVMSLRKEISSSSSDVPKFALLLTKMKFFAENLSMFDSKINGEIDEILQIYKQKEGSSILMQLTMNLERTSIGARLICEHSSLSGEHWRRRREKMQNQDNLNYVLNELDGDDIAPDVLATCYQTFLKTYEDLVSQILAVFDQKKDKEPDLGVLITQTKMLVAPVTQKANTILWTDSFKNKIPELLAYIFAVWTLKNTQHYNELRGIESARSYLLMPHAAQVLAIFRILGIGYKKGTISEISQSSLTASIFGDLINNLVQIGTGEGKSVVMAVTACVFALIGVDVNCSCYSEVLSTRDKTNFASVFCAFGVEERIEYGTFNKLCENLLNERCSVREKVHDMIINNKTTIDVVQTTEYLRPKVLLIDEVDVFLSAKFYGGMYTPSVYLRDSSIKDLLDTIWRNQTLVNLDSIKAMSAYQTCAARFSNWTFLLDEAIKDMIAALQSFQSSTHIVQNDKIVYVEGESIVDNVVRGYGTVWSYYQENKNGNISQSSLEANVGIIVNCGTFSYAEMPHEFAYITGVTGTLKTLAETESCILKSVYNVKNNTFMPSVFGKSNLTYNHHNDVQVMNESEYFMRIRGEIDNVCNAYRAVLVFFESEEKLMKFYESPELLSKQNDVQIITETVSVKERELYIKRATMIGRITLLTRTFGRGTDFICSNQQLLLNGGIHVLQTFFSEELSEEYQIKGRGARQGDYGSYRMILLDKDLEWVLGSTWKEELPRISGTALYETLQKARNALYESKCAAKELGIEQCKRDHEASKIFMTGLSEGNIKTVKDFLLEQNRGASLNTKTSRTVLLMDATISMSNLLAAAKETVCTMFERASNILTKEKLPNDSFQMQIVIYRNYNSKENKILQASSWETKASNLRAFMSTIRPEGGWGQEAIEIGLWHAVQETEMQNSISQVILIGDAPANTETEVIQKRRHHGETYWEKTRFHKSTYCPFELQKLKEKNIPVHAFYLTDYAQDNFNNIARETQGRCEYLDIYSSDGAESLTNFVTEEILRNAAGDQGDAAVRLYRTTYVRNTSF